MSTFTNTAFSTYESEDFQVSGGYQANGSVQTWGVLGTSPSYIEAIGADTNGMQPDAAIVHHSITAPNTSSFVWIRAKGAGNFKISYANDPLIETITTTASWEWYLASTALVSQSQIRFFTENEGVSIDKFIVTTANETPSDEDGFNNASTGGGTTTTTGGDGVCAGTATPACFACYELEQSFWLEPGSTGAKWLIDSSPSSGASGSFVSPDVSTTAGDVAQSAKAHLSILATQSGDWCSWFRVRGSGTFRHVWADLDTNSASISVNSTAWTWVKSTLAHDPNAAKVKVLSESDSVDVDKFILIDSDEIPTGSDGFCQSIGSGTGDGGTTPEENDNGEQNSDRYLWLPANLTCVVTVIPPEPTNR